MGVDIAQIGPDGWGAYRGIRSSFVVETVFDCGLISDGLGGIRLTERPVAEPYEKYGEDDSPSDWSKQFDLGAWGVFLATRGGETVGGAAVAVPSPGIIVTEGRTDTACLWDLRVSAAERRSGIGTGLLRRCADWARQRGFRVLAIETQNTNLPACRFYSKRGCELAEIRRFAYRDCPEVAEEAMLIWHLVL